MKYFWKGILAGVSISIGGTIFLKVGGIAGTILFSIGLIAVVSLGLNLFTGKSQFVWGMPRVKQTDVNTYGWLLGILALNFCGCMLMAVLMGSAEIREAATTIIDKRLLSPFWKNGLLAIGCGYLMTLAVQGASRKNWLPLLFGVPAFICCGFPHCVADAYYMCCLPKEYILGHIGELTSFYAAIVIGNFLGCNAYRLTSSAETSGRTAVSEEKETMRKEIF
ncbi:MAG: formate/nitrite transporter family protein [Candidatus Amulumruptor caecigallinarius]|nr:formate/nitrite transporter family protein [Candidatus Amulumruptor caecigallinarius]